MMDDDKQWEETADVLERARGARETRYFEHARELERRSTAMLEAVRAAEKVATAVALGDERLADLPARASHGSVEARIELPAQPPWPTGGGVLRRTTNRILAWLLRDYLAVLDRRHVATAESLGKLSAVADQLDARVRGLDEDSQRVAKFCQEATAFLSARVQAVAASGHERDESLREALTRAAEAVDMTSGLAERLRELVNAKDAELLHRATDGPARKIEIVFDELARRQEALLAELVGAVGRAGAVDLIPERGSGASTDSSRD